MELESNGGMGRVDALAEEEQRKRKRRLDIGVAKVNGGGDRIW